MSWLLETHDEGVVRDAVSAVELDEAWSLIEEFSGLVRESGSEDERRAAGSLVERLRRFGLTPRVHEPELYLSVPRSAALYLSGVDGEQLECKAPSFSRSTGDRPVEGELVEVSTEGIGDTRELFTASAAVDGERVAARIVLADGYAMPKVVREIEEAGAAGAIFVNPGHAHEGIVTTVWGTPGLEDRSRIPDLTVVNVTRKTGRRLRDHLRSGDRRVVLQTDLFRGWRRCPLVEVEIAGERPEFVLVHGHYDSWHVGVGDNAVGDAALLEIARVAGSMAGRWRRGIRIAWWPGHSTARYGGSTWYADRFALELRERCVAQIDVDSPGCRWATAYDEVMWMDEAAEFARAAIEDATGIEARGTRPLRAGDYSFNGLGITGFFMLLSNIPEEVRRRKGFYPVGGCGGNSDAWHVEGDVLEVADRENLERDLRVYVTAIARLATARFLPFDYREAVDRIREAVEGYGEVAEGAFDVDPAVEACRRLRCDLDRFYERARESLEGGGDPALDAAQMALARHLVPVGYSAAPRFRHDPAVEVPPVPDLAVLERWPELSDDPDGRRFLLAQALRGRNRVVAELRGARRHLAGC